MNTRLKLPARSRTGRAKASGRLAALLLLVLLQACGYRVPEPERYPLEGVNSSVKAGDLLITSQPDPQVLAQLAEAGYKSIISTRGEGEIDWDEAAAVRQLGMTFYQVPMQQPVSEISDPQVDQLTAALRDAAKPVVLHCGSGNRASALWAVWLVEEKGVAVEEALRLAGLTGMTSMRPVAEKRLKSDITDR